MRVSAHVSCAGIRNRTCAGIRTSVYSLYSSYYSLLRRDESLFGDGKVWRVVELWWVKVPVLNLTDRSEQLTVADLVPPG